MIHNLPLVLNMTGSDVSPAPAGLIALTLYGIKKETIIIAKII